MTSGFHPSLLIAPVVTAVSLVMACSPARDWPTTAAQQVQSDLDALIASGSAGTQATLTDGARTTVVTSGVADRQTNSPIPDDAQFRVGSTSKAFIATIVLQLVGEGAVNLDDPISKYIPGRVARPGIDDSAITIRQLMQQRSGLPEFAGEPGADEFQAAREHRTLTADDALAIALRKPAQFAPGQQFKYTNTNYLVLAMVIEAVTGKAYATELQERILTPLQLSNTYLPVPGDTEIRGPHPKGYALVDGSVVDATEVEPSVPGAAGGLISTGDDLNRFFLALLAGKLLPDAQLAAMKDASAGEVLPGINYGLGLTKTDLSCGTSFFGHPGGITGYVTIAGSTDDGRATTIVITQPPEEEVDMKTLIDHAVCH